MKLIEEAEKFEPCYEYEHCKAPMLIEQLLEEIQTTNHRYLDLQQVCDDQAKQIATLKEEADCSDIYTALEGAGIDMGDNEQPQDIITAIGLLAGWVATLKAALLTEKSYHLYYKCQGDCGRGICSAGAHKKDARVALARELPEIDWEDKQ